MFSYTGRQNVTRDQDHTFEFETSCGDLIVVEFTVTTHLGAYYPATFDSPEEGGEVEWEDVRIHRVEWWRNEDWGKTPNPGPARSVEWDDDDREIHAMAKRLVEARDKEVLEMVTAEWEYTGRH